MKKYLFGISLSLLAINCTAGDPEFLQFALKQAHSKGFMGCDAAISEAFKDASGNDFANEMKTFDFLAETGDYIWMKSKIGIPMFLKPLNGGCIATFQQGASF